MPSPNPCLRKRPFHCRRSTRSSPNDGAPHGESDTRPQASRAPTSAPISPNPSPKARKPEWTLLGVASATDLVAYWIVDDDSSARTKGACGVRCVAWHNRSATGSSNLFHTGNRYGQLPIHDVPHLFLRMVMLVKRHGIGVNFVVGESHIL